MPQLGLRAEGSRRGGRGAAIIGVLVWAIPLIVASGGLVVVRRRARDPGRRRLLRRRDAVDASTPRARALDAVLNSFLWPWAHPVAGGIVVAIAAVGCVRLAWRTPRTLGLLLVAFVPYAIFHLLFQETVTVRYALPLVIPVAYLVASALEWPGRGVLPAGAAALAAWSLIVTLPATVTYGRSGSPAFRALREAAASAAAIASIRRSRNASSRIHAVARRAVEWMGARAARARADGAARPRVARRSSTTGNRVRAPSSCSSPIRGEPISRSSIRRPDRRPLPYRWGFVEPPFVGGARPGNTDVYAHASARLDAGSRMGADGRSRRRHSEGRRGPHQKPSVAWIRRRSDEALLMIGGRHLGAAADPDRPHRA